MTTEDENKPDVDTPEPSADERTHEVSVDASGSKALSSTTDEPGQGDGAEAYETPAQLGSQRFVYAAYFAGGIAIAFILSKALSYGWTRLNLWKPEVGEPHEEVVMSVAALVGFLVAFYYYRDEKTRTLAEEVASELGQVSWPTRDEVVNGTFVVVVTTFVATAFFALMDRFWGFVTNLVYGA